ncbi:MAG: YkgJ family cysteine cluster protein [Thermodesulfobacteriota bacterium]
MTENQDGLDNYQKFLTQIDERCAEILADHGSYIVCRRGCDDCCRHISVFAVEAVAMARALSRLSRADLAMFRRQAAAAQPDGPCPLLDQGICRLYAARPIICRTHGLPILISQNGNTRVDFCPKNFTGLSTLPGNAVLYLERINETLAAINRLFTETHLPDLSPLDRFTVAEVLLLELGDDETGPGEVH